MIGICSKCGNNEWDKEITENRIRCPKCGFEWSFQRLPIFFLTGCSGIGKTTTAMELQKLTSDFIVLDADLFYNILHPQDDQESNDMVEQILSISKNINQANKPVVWTMAGYIDKLTHTYNSRFFSDIKVLALTANQDILKKRMIEGRGIKDENWINGSIEYNEFFKTHDCMDETKFQCLDCSMKTPYEVAMDVLAWLEKEKNGFACVSE